MECHQHLSVTRCCAISRWCHHCMKSQVLFTLYSFESTVKKEAVGNLYGVPVYVETSLTGQETMTFPVGTSTVTMNLRYADFERLVHPGVMAFAQTAALA
jgi:hypothetical protein